MFAEIALFAVCFWTPVFCPVFCSLMSIFMHMQAQLTDRGAIVINGEVVLISKVSGMAGVKVDKRCDIFPSVVFIDSINIVGGFQKKFFNTEFREYAFIVKNE